MREDLTIAPRPPWGKLNFFQAELDNPKPMNDNVSLALGGASRSGLGGLPQRLVQDGVVEEAAMLEALAAARERKTSVVTQLVSRGIASARDIAVAASDEFGVPLFDLDAVNLDLDSVRLVSDKLLAKHRVLPIFRRGKRLFLAVADPTNQHAIDEIKFQTSLAIEAVIVEDDKLQKAVDKAIEQVDSQMSALTDAGDVDLESLEVTGGEEELDDKVGRDDVEDAPIVRFVNKVMLDEIRRGASDIHFEPFEKIYRVRLRMDGVLKEIAQPPVVLAPKLSARLKVMSRLDIAERRVPQDGRIKMKLSKNRAIDFRVSSCPTLFGEKIVLRILDPAQAMLGIDALGYEPHQKEMYLKHLAKPQGMILVTGPTGSGKTVSLYTGLHILNKEDTNISTAEDPAEINLQGVNQVNVNNKVGLTLAAALRAEGFTEEEIPTLKICGPVGCANCTDGYKGRAGLYQVMEVTESIGRIIMSGGNALDISDQAIKEGVWDLRRAGLEKVKAGLT